MCNISPRKLDALSLPLRLLLYSGENIFAELVLTTLEDLVTANIITVQENLGQLLILTASG